ncbi:MAG: ABC transporter permease, partial [Bryobacteraceae bacterium]
MPKRGKPGGSMFWRRRKAREEDLERELRSALELEAEEQRENGLSSEEARYAAQRAVGNIALIKEDSRAAWGWPSLEAVFQDLRFAIRQFRKSPGFASTAIFVLGLGICAAVSIFGFVDAALLKPLPYRDPSRLVAVFETTATNSRSYVSYQDYLDWKRLNPVFSSIDAYAANGGFTLNTKAGAQVVSGTRVTAGFFQTLGVTPVLGRNFRAGEDHLAAPPAVLLSYGAWQTRFGGRSDVLGRTVTLNNTANT